MKSTSPRHLLFAVLVLMSLGCFIYVNTTSLDRTLQAQGMNEPTVESVEKVSQNAKMPDLTLFKNGVVLIQKFLTAK
jgi:uncharacterized protein (UPF0333 family)